MKIRIDKPEFTFNPEKGTTTCELYAILKPGVINLGHPDIQRIILKHGFTCMGIIRLCETAYLKPTDTWDPEIGKKVSEVKCTKKLFHKLVSLNSAVSDLVEKEINDKDDGDLFKYLNALVNELHYFESLCE